MSVDNPIFVPHAVKLARKTMNLLGYTELANKFATVVQFLELNPKCAAVLRGNNTPHVGTKEYIQAIAHSFVNARAPRSPVAPSTIPDEMVSFILYHYFDLPESELIRI
jgi:hypothetical protein